MSQHNEQPSGEKEPLEPDVKRIVRAAGNETLAPEDKAELWERIKASVSETQPVYRRLWWKVAAAVAVLIAAGWWILQERPAVEKGVLAFAKQQQHIADTSTETRLVLGNNRQVTLKGATASLTYSGNGTQVMVNNSQQYQQETGEAAQYNTLIVPYGRRASITMEDGTQVWLNAGSRMIYPVVFDGKSREVFLEGEAYFDVAQHAESPFFVYTSELKTAVLGTAFNISAYADDAEQTVVLTEGSVKVLANAGGAEQLLTPGYKAGYVVIDRNISKERVNTLEYTAWKDGRLMFAHAQLQHILKKLSRYFNIPITTATNVQSTFSGDLDLADDIRNVLDAVSVSTGLKYDYTPAGVILKQK